jgi:hypothetical protein
MQVTGASPRGHRARAGTGQAAPVSIEARRRKVDTEIRSTEARKARVTLTRPRSAPAEAARWRPASPAARHSSRTRA